MEPIIIPVHETPVFLNFPENGGKDNDVEGDQLHLNPTEGEGDVSASSENVEAVDLESSPESESTSGKCLCANYLGIILALGSGFIITITALIVKYMNDYHPITLAAFRFQGVLFPVLVLALYYRYGRKENVLEAIWPLTDKQNLKRFVFNNIRGVFGGSSVFLLYYSIQTLTLADALVIGSCGPVFVTVIAHTFLGEPCGIFPVIAAGLTVVGVVLIARPPILTGEDSFDKPTMAGVGLAFVAMLVASFSLVLLRYLRDVHVSIVTLTFGIWGTIISVCGSLAIWRFDLPSTPKDTALAFSLAVATFIAQVGLTMAMQYEQAGVIAIVRTFDTITAFGLQFFILGTVPDLYSLIGANLIISCVLMIAFRKWVSTLPENHSARRTCWFVLK